MRRIRVIPTLLLQGKGLVKTTKFKDPAYVGDPINAIRIFNEKEVDELVLLDIEATRWGRGPDLRMLASVTGECFMPLCYGGGVTTLGQIDAVLKVGVEKVAVNAALIEHPDVVREAAKLHGSSTIVGSIDFKRDQAGQASAWTRSGGVNTHLSVVELARRAEDLGVGEILLTSIDRDGTMAGYDLEVLHAVASAVTVPVIASGGAGSLADMRAAVQEGGASAVAAGAFFVFLGRHRAVLITYPSQPDLTAQVFR